jgi:type I restriction enzyme, S subunit
MNQLPVEWALCALGDVVQLNPKHELNDNTIVGFAPMAMLPTDFHGVMAHEPKPWLEVKKGYTQFRDGDVLFAKVTPCFENGKAAIASGLPSGVGAGSTEYFVLRQSGELLNEKYLLALVKTREFLLNGALNMTGSVGLKRVPKDFVQNYPFPLPPLAEQTQIAAKLDELLAQVDSIKARIDAIPAILKRFRQSVLAAAVSGRLTEKWRSLEGLDRESWTRTELQRICIPGRVITYGVVKLGNEVPDGVPCLRTSNIRRLRFELEGIKKIAPALSDEYSRTILRGGEILINVRGTLGGVAVARTEMAGWNVSREVAVIPVNTKKLDPRLLAYWLASDQSQLWLAGVQKGVAYVGINIEDLRTLPMEIPSETEQTEIVRLVDELFAFADQIEQRVKAAQARVNPLTQAILAKAFRGELTAEWRAQNPDLITGENSAQALLERIRAERANAKPQKRKRRGNHESHESHE